MSIKNETNFKVKDVRLLRERLAWVYKKCTPDIQTQITQTLLAFAKSVSEYCQCEEKVYIAKENKFACLNCGTRHIKAEGDIKLKVVK